MENKIKVLHVVFDLNSNGVTSLLLNIYNNIPIEKYQFDFLVNKEGEHKFERDFTKNGSNIYRTKHLEFKNFFEYKRNIKKLIIENNYDIVHCHYMNIALLLYFDKDLRNNVKIIAHSHSDVFNYGGVKGFIKGLIYKLFKIININYFACTKEAAKNTFGNRKDVKIIRNSIDTGKFKYNETLRSYIRSQLKLNNQHVYGHVGVFEEVKNHDFLIDVFYEIKKVNVDSKLILVGEGSLLDKIKDKTKKLNLDDSIYFLGARKDINELLSAIDFLIFPSKYEGVPLALVEAQCNGLKIFASSTISTEVELTKNIKFLSIEYSSKYWARTIIDNKKVENREKYANIVKDKGFDINSTSNQIQEIYQNLVSDN